MARGCRAAAVRRSDVHGELENAVPNHGSKRHRGDSWGRCDREWHCVVAGFQAVNSKHDYDVDVVHCPPAVFSVFWDTKQV